MKSRLAVSVIALALIALPGCSREVVEPRAAATASVAAEITPAPSSPPAATTNSGYPALKVDTVQGQPYDLAAHRGKWVVVNFWATWCAPCIKEMPELSDLDQRRDDVEVIGLAYEEIEVQAMRDFLIKRPVVYPVAIVDVYAPPADFATPRGLPMTYLIGPRGEVARQFLGPVTASEIETAISTLGGTEAKG
ncbi:MAG: TlpA disulfide reductase family protein [Pseudoxanthomonas sp.]